MRIPNFFPRRIAKASALEPSPASPLPSPALPSSVPSRVTGLLPSARVTTKLPALREMPAILEEAPPADLPPGLQAAFSGLSFPDRQDFKALWGAFGSKQGAATRAQLAALLANGTLGKTGVLDNLKTLLDGPPWNGFKGDGVQVDLASEVAQVVGELADPSRISQGVHSEYCVAASVMARLALTEPARFTGMAADLFTQGESGDLTVNAKALGASLAENAQLHDGRSLLDSVLMSSMYQSVGNAGDGRSQVTPAEYISLYEDFFPRTTTVGPDAVPEAGVLAAAKQGPVSLMFYNMDAKGNPIPSESHTVTVWEDKGGLIHMLTNGKEKIWHQGGKDALDFDQLFQKFFAGGNLPTSIVTTYHTLSNAQELARVQQGLGSTGGRTTGISSTDLGAAIGQQTDQVIARRFDAVNQRIAADPTLEALFGAPLLKAPVSAQQDGVGEQGTTGAIATTGGGERGLVTTGGGERGFATTGGGERGFVTTGGGERGFVTTGGGERGFVTTGGGERGFVATGGIEVGVETTDGGGLL